jgi:hypothetical protein
MDDKDLALRDGPGSECANCQVFVAHYQTASYAQTYDPRAVCHGAACE